MVNNITKVALTVLVIASVISGVSYEKEARLINSKKEDVYVLDLDMNNPLVELKNSLSFDKLYGFQTMTDMVDDEADYAVNGMFYDTMGKPYGSIIEDGDIVQLMDIGKPILVVDYANRVFIGDADISFKFNANTGNAIDIDCVNGALYDGQWGFFNSYNGTTTRVSGEATSYILKDGKVVERRYQSEPTEISDEYQVLVKRGRDSSYNVGDNLRFRMKIDFSDVFMKVPLFVDKKGLFKPDKYIKTMFNLGAWLVKDGENVAEDYDSFVGPTITNQPRTMVGVTDDNHLVFIVVDGRRDDSKGISGYECAELLLEYGVIDGGYLDGGASSEMMVDGEVVNQPSAGDERKIAHAIAIYEK